MKEASYVMLCTRNESILTIALISLLSEILHSFPPYKNKNKKDVTVDCQPVGSLLQAILMYL